MKPHRGRGAVDVLRDGVEPALQLVFTEDRVSVAVPRAIVADGSKLYGLLEDFETDAVRFDGTATTQTVSRQRCVVIGR